MPTPLLIGPLPYNSPVIEDPKTWRLRFDWRNWLQSIKDALDKSARVIGSVNLTGQSASITATAVGILKVHTGLYRISYYARITTPASTSSELTPQVNWTDGGVACNFTGALMNGNTTSTVQSNSVLVQADVDTTITYQSTYASVGATAMQYLLIVVVERVPEA